MGYVEDLNGFQGLFLCFTDVKALSTQKNANMFILPLTLSWLPLLIQMNISEPDGQKFAH